MKRGDRVARPKIKKEAILKSANQIFGSKGYHEASMIEIAELAEVGKGTLYEYFPSKSVLFLEVMRYTAEKYIEQMADAIAQSDNFNGKLDDFIKTYREIIGENYQKTGIFLTSQNAMNMAAENSVEVMQIICSMRDQGMKLILLILECGKNEGKIQSENLEFVADIFIDMVHRSCIRIFYHEMTSEQIETESNLLLKLLLNGIAR